MGVGLNIGFAQVGPISKGEARDFTAVGDVISTGARLQSSAQEFEIVLSQHVYAAFADNVPEGKETTFNAKGKAEPLKAFVIPDSVGIE